METIKELLIVLQNYHDWLGEETNNLLWASGLNPQDATEDERANFELDAMQNNIEDLALFEMDIAQTALAAFDDLQDLLEEYGTHVQS